MSKRNRLFGIRNRRGKQSQATRCKQVSLHLEQLEQRMLMNADNNPAPLADTDDSIQVLPILPAPALTIATPIFLPISADDVGPWRPLTPKPLPALPETGFESVEELRGWLIDTIDAQYGDLFGTNSSYKASFWPYLTFDTNVAALVPFSLLGNGTALATSSSDSFSGTNVQVEGVDEADLIETDGKYLYLVSGNELIIVDARDSENLSIASRVKLEDRPTGIYLSGDRLTLISSQGPSVQPGNGRFFGFADRSFSGFGSQSATTTVTVLDLTDRTAPSQVQKTEFRGNLVSSRMVDGQLRLVLNQSGFQKPNLPRPKIDYVLNEETGQKEGTYETREEYLDRVLDATIDSLLSTYRTFSVDGEVLDQAWLVQPNELRGYQPSRTIIATFDVLGNDAGPADVEMLRTGGATEVYSTQDSLYVFEESGGYRNTKTTIWKFDFDSDDHSINLAAKGEVEGAMLNQFSADEYNGYLRIVTQERSWNSDQALFVLEQVGDQLKVVGSVDSLAPRENLHSVRFLGDKAFVVTFQKVDPLFAIDLSDPTNPTVAGELKIPGYSDYLQPINENYLLGIGRGADESSGLFQEMQISIFDVSDLNDPQPAHRFSLDGGRSTASIATGGRWTQGDIDSLAVSYFPSEQILALPIQSEGSWGGRFWGGVDNTPIFEPGEGGLQVFSVDTETGFESLAIIEHDTPILRSLRIGESLLAFSEGEISSYDITGSIDQLDSLQLQVGSEIGLVELTAFSTPPSAVDFQTVGYAMATLKVEAFSASLDLLNTTSSVATETLSPAFSVLPSSSTDITDSVFTVANPFENTSSFRFVLDHVLLDELVHDQLSYKGLKMGT